MAMSSDALKALDADFGGALSDLVAEGGFEGKRGSATKAVRVGSAPNAKAKVRCMVLGRYRQNLHTKAVYYFRGVCGRHTRRALAALHWV